MRFQRLGLFFAFTFLFFGPAIQAQQSPTPAPRDAQAVSLLQHSLAALAGMTTVKDVTLNGSANWIAGSDNESGSATLKATAIGQGRVDLSLSGGQRSEVMDVSQVPPTGSWSGIDGAWHPMVAHNLFGDPTWFFPSFLLGRSLSSANYAILPVDAETQDGVPVEHVRIYQQPSLTGQTASVLQSLSQIDIFLNASTLLPTSILFSVHADANALVDIPIEIKFASYQVVQGVSIPYHIQKYVQNALALDVTVTAVQINSGLSATDFQAQ